MFFLKKKLNPLNLFFSKKVRNALFCYNSKINKNLRKNKNLRNLKQNKILRNLKQIKILKQSKNLRNLKKNKNFKKTTLLKDFLKNLKKNKTLRILKKKKVLRIFKKRKLRNINLKKIKTKRIIKQNKILRILKKNKKIFGRKKKTLRNYFTELVCQLKKNKCKLKKKKIFKHLVWIARNAFYFKSNIKKSRKKFKRRKFWIEEKYMDPEFTTSLINLLKVDTKFQYVNKPGFKYCKLFFKYTGSNFFGTITDANGNVYFSYSSGIFNGLNTRKEKTTIFVVKHLGELLSLRLYKSNVGEIIFIPLINHRKIRTFLKFLIYGFREMKMMNFVKMIPKRKIMRNGVRLKKVARK